MIFQITANLLFKWGSTAPHLYWWGFGLGNAVGITSILFMLGMYQNLPAANVVAIGTGGTFLLNQIAMFLVYHEKIQIGGLIGIALILAGVLLVAFCNKAPENKNMQDVQTTQQMENVQAEPEQIQQT